MNGCLWQYEETTVLKGIIMSTAFSGLTSKGVTPEVVKAQFAALKGHVYSKYRKERYLINAIKLMWFGGLTVMAVACLVYLAIAKGSVTADPSMVSLSMGLFLIFVCALGLSFHFYKVYSDASPPPSERFGCWKDALFEKEFGDASACVAILFEYYDQKTFHSEEHKNAFFKYASQCLASVDQYGRYAWSSGDVQKLMTHSLADLSRTFAPVYPPFDKGVFAWKP